MAVINKQKKHLRRRGSRGSERVRKERELFIDNLMVRIHFIIVMMWTGLAPWEFELPFPGSLTSTLPHLRRRGSRGSERVRNPPRPAPNLSGVWVHRKVQRFRGGLAIKARRLFYHITLCWRVIKKKKNVRG